MQNLLAWKARESLDTVSSLDEIRNLRSFPSRLTSKIFMLAIKNYRNNNEPCKTEEYSHYNAANTIRILLY